MSLFAIGDPHLSFGCQKPMDIFRGWENHADRLSEHWRRVVSDEDTVVLPGDISWAMNLESLLPDLQFLNQLPGKKVLLKGNHDYWWTTKQKMEQYLHQNGLDRIAFLHNNCICAEGFRLCGTRGWLFENGQPQDEKVLAREAGRLRLSLEAAKNQEGELLVFLHYPPVFGQEENRPMLDTLQEYGVKRVFYGHIHGHGCVHALNGVYRGIAFRLVSSDFLGFCPAKIEKSSLDPALF